MVNGGYYRSANFMGPFREPQYSAVVGNSQFTASKGGFFSGITEISKTKVGDEECDIIPMSVSWYPRSEPSQPISSSEGSSASSGGAGGSNSFLSMSPITFHFEEGQRSVTDTNSATVKFYETILKKNKILADVLHEEMKVYFYSYANADQSGATVLEYSITIPANTKMILRSVDTNNTLFSVEFKEAVVASHLQSVGNAAAKDAPIHIAAPGFDQEWTAISTQQGAGAAA